MAIDTIIESAARLGYASKGLAHVAVGVLLGAAAARFTFGEITNTKGAIEVFDSGTLAPVALMVVAVGLFGYVAWRVVQAIWDPEDDGNGGMSGVIRRIFYLAIAGVYASVAVLAFKEVIGLATDSSGPGATEKVTSWVLDLPFGKYVVMAAGLGVLAYAAYRFNRAYQNKFLDKLDEWEMPRPVHGLSRWLGSLGIFGRSVVIAVAGGLVVYAGYSYDPSAAGGSEEAIRWLYDQPWGGVLLFALSVCFVCYGLFLMVKARYRQIGASFES